MSQTDINIACNVILNNSPAFDVVWENSSSKPTDTHYQQSFIPVESENISVEYDGSQELSGIYQVLIVIPIDKGLADAITGEADLLNKFSRGTSLNYNSQIAEVEKTYIGSGFQNDRWWVVPVSVEYRGFVSG